MKENININKNIETLYSLLIFLHVRNYLHVTSLNNLLYLYFLHVKSSSANFGATHTTIQDKQVVLTSITGRGRYRRIEKTKDVSKEATNDVISSGLPFGNVQKAVNNIINDIGTSSEKENK